MTGVYCLTSPSGKSYIGQSVNIERRLRSYKRHQCEKQPKLSNAIKKYGFVGFKVTILAECSQMELNDVETFYINYFSTILSGYNIKDGGSNGKVSIETRMKMSLSHKGVKLSDEHRKSLSKSLNTDDVKRKMSISHRGVKLSDEHRKSLSIAQKKVVVSKEQRDKMILSMRSRNENWGTTYSKHRGYFVVRFRENGIRYTKTGFPTSELAKRWRDEQLFLQI